MSRIWQIANFNTPTIRSGEKAIQIKS